MPALRRGLCRSRGSRAESLEPRRLFATFTVTTDADSGPGSLRDAIAQANAAGGADEIHFAIGSGQQTIAPLSPLPAVTGTTAIDATTQPGYAGSPLVVLSGANLSGAGLTVNSANSAVRGLVVNGCAAAAGIRLTANADGTTVTNCYLGTDAGGANPVPNSAGVRIDAGCADATIGGTDAADRNVIAGNLADGVVILGGTDAGNTIRGNVIRDNGALGINLAGGTQDANGVTANDPGDADAGPNNLQNYPVLATARTANGSAAGRATGTLNSTPNTAYAVDLYANASTDGNGNAEGGTFLGSVDVTTNGNGDATFAMNYGSVFGAPVITATATGPAGSTSEFSAPAVQGFNADPTPNFDSYLATEDTPISVDAAQGVLANDFDTDGDALAVALSSPAAHGAVQLNADGSFTYTPDVNYSGPDGFTYSLTDGLSTSFGTVDLDVAGVPDPGTFAFSAPDFFVTEDAFFALVTVVRTGGSDGFETVDYAAKPGTATAFDDFFPESGTLEFFPGQVSQDIYVSIELDTIDEPDESLAILLSNPTGGASVDAAASTATLTIVNADAPPGLSINDPAPVPEGGPGGGGVIPFVLTLAEPSADPVDVRFSFGFGTATQGEDFDDAAAPGKFGLGSVTFEPGQTTATVAVPIIGDTTNEFDETVTINLFGVQNAILTDNFAFGFIANDDNQLPTAAVRTVTRAPAEGAVTLDVFGNGDATSPDGDALTLSLASQAALGVAAVDNRGTPGDPSDDVIVYTPDPGGLSDDSFTYTVTDVYGGTATATVTVQTRGTSTLVSPLDPAKTDVLVAATSGADAVRVQRTNVRGELRVTMNGEEVGVFSPTGRLILAAGEGDDVLDLRGVTTPVEIHGGAGADTIKAGKGADVIFGGDGDDVLHGGTRRDVLIGGGGRDRLYGGGEDDILIAGTTAFDGPSPEAVQFRADLFAAWTAPGNRAARLNAIAAGTLESKVYLDASILLDDAAPDFLAGNGGGDWFFAVSDPTSPTRDRFSGAFGEDDFTELDAAQA